MTLSEILLRAEKARLLGELKTELAKTLGAPGNVPIPRGWTAGEARLFEALPAAVQEVVWRRRDQDMREIRRLQNMCAELKHSLTQPSRSSAPIKERETTHA
jgi:hypothetical protein